VFDLIGRYIPLIEHVKLTSRKGLVISSVLRFLLVPAFYYTTKYGSQGWMIVLTSFLGLTNGYLTVCVLTEAPKGFKVSSVFLIKLVVIFYFLFSAIRKVWSTFLYPKARTERSGQHSYVFPTGGPVLWGSSWLVVAYR
jgi:hypothetical protein